MPTTSELSTNTEPTNQLVSISGLAEELRVKPSRFNARSQAPDGSLLLYNSLSGAFSGVPPRLKQQAEALLQQKGTLVQKKGMAQYLLDRGFLVPSDTNEMNRLRTIYGQQQYRADRLELILLASEECNFRCVYCYETFPRATMEPWVQQAVLNLILRRVQQVRSLHISWFGGEPLLGLEAIREIAPKVKQMALDHQTSYASNMTTNGLLLTPDIFRELLDYDIRSFQISLDGDSTSHDCKRVLKDGGATFDTIYSNLVAAKSFIDTFTITIRVNFDEANLPHLSTFLTMLQRDFADDPRFDLRFFPVGKWGGDNDANLSVCGSSGYSSKMELERQAAKMGLNPEDRLPSMQAQTGLGVCYAARPYNFIIGADGKIMKCTIALDQQASNIVGKLNPDGIADINGERLAAWVAPEFEDDQSCRKCFYSPVCQGCSCPLVRIESGARPCPDEKKQIGPTLQTLWELKKDKAHRYTLAGQGQTRADTSQAGSFSPPTLSAQTREV